MSMQEVFNELLEVAAILTALSTIAIILGGPEAGTYGAGIALGLWASAGWLWLRGAV
jgi:hypothetical protein